MRFGLAVAILLSGAVAGLGQTAGHESLTGTLRDISSSSLTIRTSDRRSVDVSLSAATKFLRQSQGSIGFADLNPGDQVVIDALTDGAGVYRAASITLIQSGTPADRPGDNRVQPQILPGDSNARATPVPDTRRDPDDPGPPASPTERPVLPLRPARRKTAPAYPPRR